MSWSGDGRSLETREGEREAGKSRRITRRVGTLEETRCTNREGWRSLSTEGGDLGIDGEEAARDWESTKHRTRNATEVLSARVLWSRGRRYWRGSSKLRS